ncbi:MAG: SDR family oxidoreductase [Pirellulales bacterium]|nr:SDR family oxidoreductase [Pirellulales bacterium]
MSFLQLRDKAILIAGAANRKSVAWHVAQMLRAEGAKVVLSVRSEARRDQIMALWEKTAGKFSRQAPSPEFHVCDVEHEDQITSLAESVAKSNDSIHGIVHSIAFADYSEGPKPFHATDKEAFLRAIDVSCFSLIALANAFKDLLAKDGSVVTISISTTEMASENYGFMAPAKAALDSTVVFLAKSFSQFSDVRFNAVGPGLLKTSASAGIPGYVDSYLFAEHATLRKRAVQTEEAAGPVAFLLSPRSSGINAQRIPIDAGMRVNYFDREIVRRVIGGSAPSVD